MTSASDSKASQFWGRICRICGALFLEVVDKEFLVSRSHVLFVFLGPAGLFFKKLNEHNLQQIFHKF